MALDFVANSNMTLSVADDAPSGVQASILSVGPTSDKVQAVNAFVVVDGHNITVTNVTNPSNGATIPDPGPYNVSINATATKVKATQSGSLQLVARVGDKTGTINATPQIPGSPNPTDFPVSFVIEITDAGQTKVKAQ